LPANAPGPLFVDRTCIDCDTCRQLAPATFTDVAGKSSVRAQPQSPADLDAALRALIACPVGAIGDATHRPLHDAIAAFSLPIDGPVSLLGFNARDSYGANSYFLQTGKENWMIDAPRWNAALAHALEERGGVHTIFLTHRDDVADAARISLAATISRGTANAARSTLTGTSAGLTGRCSSSRSPGCTIWTLRGGCPATETGSASIPRRCGRRSPRSSPEA
jgi:ferredoxin